MRFARFLDPKGYERRGEWVDDGIRSGGTRYDRDDVTVLPPSKPTKIIGVGGNYVDHAEEMGSEPPDSPWLFTMPPSALAGHGSDVTLPSGADRVDHEAELGAVIGTQCRNVDAAEAMDVLDGFTCVNDVSNRSELDLRGRHPSFVFGKAFDGATPIGPVVATPDEVPDDATIELRVNGEKRQDSSIDNLHFSVPELVEAISARVTLEPGDVIATGTPAGVGPLADGDRVEISIEGVGTLVHGVAEP